MQTMNHYHPSIPEEITHNNTIISHPPYDWLHYSSCPSQSASQLLAIKLETRRRLKHKALTIYALHSFPWLLFSFVFLLPLISLQLYLLLHLVMCETYFSTFSVHNSLEILFSSIILLFVWAFLLKPFTVSRVMVVEALVGGFLIVEIYGFFLLGLK